MKSKIQVETVERANLERVMSFQFDPLVHRMMDKHKWSEDTAREAFEDMKKFLFLCAVTEGTLAPPPVIDEIWHNFILFTLDYEEFCLTKVGRFIHHRPNRRGDMKRNGIIPRTLAVANELFAPLSVHWEFKAGVADCGEDCSGGSTNCQDS